eukprot:5899723-Amphidinium_carterae.2
MASEKHAQGLEQAFRQSEVREQKLESGARASLQEMAENVNLLTAQSLSLSSECRESVLERDALQQTVAQVRQEFERVTSYALEGFDGVRFLETSSSPVLNSLADGSFGQSQQSNALPSFHTSGGIGSGPSQSSQCRVWTDVFMQKPTALPPGLSSVDSLKSHKQTVLEYNRQ